MEAARVLNISNDGQAIKRNIIRLKHARDHAELGTPEYDRLSEELMKEYEILKKWKESRFYIDPKTGLTLLVIGGLVFIVIMLEQENPKIMKVAQFVIKLFRFG